MRRVVVTGVGAITPIGLHFEEFWKNLCAGVSGVREISTFDTTDLPVKIAAEIPDFDPRNYIDFKAARRMDRFAQYAIAATGQALEDAHLPLPLGDPERFGAMINTGTGGIQTLVRESLNFLSQGSRRVSPFAIPMFVPNMAACQVSITFGIEGPVMASVAACASGAQAFVDAYRLFQSDEVDAMVVGGTEAVMGYAVVAFSAMGALSRRHDDPAAASRPFDRDRDGCVLGEGCGILVLESEEHALRRGAKIYCELLGGALTGDACHVSMPSRDGAGAARAMRLALQRSRLAPDEIDYICAHGTATPLNDVAETAAIKSTFGDAAYRIPASSAKSMIGHTFGAAGAMSGVISVMAIRDQIVPPTINLDTPDPECDLDYVPHIARELPVNAVMANAFGFGGQNAVVIFKRYEA